MVDQVLKLPEGDSCLLLAPLIAARKGEHFDVLAELGSQGFVRVRIDGTVHELDAAPKLDPKKKHDIEAVVDRFKVRGPHCASATAWRGWLHHRQARGAGVLQPPCCPVCGYSVPELEPKMFSFNSPAGACRPAMDSATRSSSIPRAWCCIRSCRWPWRDPRLGSPQCLLFPADPGAEPALPLRHRSTMGEAAREDQHVVLHGSGEEPINFRYVDARGRTAKRAHPFEASCRTSSAASARLSPPRCARSWGNTVVRDVRGMRRRALNRTARQCMWPTRRYRRLHGCRWRRPWSTTRSSLSPAGAARSRRAS